MTTSPVAISRYLHQKKPLWNAIAILYTIIGYITGLALSFTANIALNILGVLLLSHSLILSAYLSHELMHGTIFDKRAANERLGNLMLWLNGGCYARFDDLARLHMGHHINRVDFCYFDLAAYLKSLPAPIRKILLGLEWLYFPSLAFLLRLRSIFAPFWNPKRRHERLRTAIILLVRISGFTLLGWASLKALALYFLAYLIMLNIMRFVDAFQHTYDVFPTDAPLPQRDRAYEQANTFSNLISQRYWWLNLLLLNFGYHNAHHELMKCPWHSLHELDRELFSGTEPHYIPLGQLLQNYHRYRIFRIHSGQGQAIDTQGHPTLDTFYGAIEVSFLVLPS